MRYWSLESTLKNDNSWIQFRNRIIDWLILLNLSIHQRLSNHHMKSMYIPKLSLLILGITSMTLRDTQRICIQIQFKSLQE
jgi:hypothetical protein